MTLDADRRVGVPMVCPFVAFADERDMRSDEPDHRHRCYAEPRPAPRALAHQERYCLSPGFTTCPTFQDWAAREAAQVAPQPPAAVPASAAPGFFDELGAAGAAAAAAPAEGAIPDAANEGDHEARAAADQDGTPSYMAGAPGGVEPVVWARSRRRENYPRLRGAGVNLSPLIVGIVALALAAGALFLLPTLLTGMFGGGASPALSSPSPSASATPGEPTPTPLPTPLVYTVKKGDTLTKIANSFGVSLQKLLDANPRIKDQNKINVGDPITIPTASPAPTTPAGTTAP